MFILIGKDGFPRKTYIYRLGHIKTHSYRKPEWSVCDVRSRGTALMRYLSNQLPKIEFLTKHVFGLKMTMSEILETCFCSERKAPAGCLRSKTQVLDTPAPQHIPDPNFIQNGIVDRFFDTVALVWPK